MSRTKGLRIMSMFLAVITLVSMMGTVKASANNGEDKYDSNLDKPYVERDENPPGEILSSVKVGTYKNGKKIAKIALRGINMANHAYGHNPEEIDTYTTKEGEYARFNAHMHGADYCYQEIYFAKDANGYYPITASDVKHYYTSAKTINPRITYAGSGINFNTNKEEYVFDFKWGESNSYGYDDGGVTYVVEYSLYGQPDSSGQNAPLIKKDRVYLYSIYGYKGKRITGEIPVKGKSRQIRTIKVTMVKALGGDGINGKKLSLPPVSVVYH